MQGKYRVLVQGIRVVDAQSDQEAELLAAKESGLMDCETTVLGEVEEIVVQPDSARHVKRSAP